MSNKTSRLEIRIKDTLLEQVKKVGEQLNFIQPNGTINISRTIRYLLIVALSEETRLNHAELTDLL